jgi:hypothetical protein
MMLIRGIITEISKPLNVTIIENLFKDGTKNVIPSIFEESTNWYSQPITC